MEVCGEVESGGISGTEVELWRKENQVTVSENEI